MHDTVQPDQTVILQYSSGGRAFVDVAEGKIIRIMRIPISLNPIIGAHYGDVFEISGGRFVAVKDNILILNEDNVEEFQNAQVVDNRDLTDSQSAQSMTQSDIERMRAEGSSGMDIVQSLKDNSGTFQSKTEFSQAKWLVRKSKKHILRVRVLPVTAHSLCSIYAEHNPVKIAGLRTDTLALILGAANVCSGQTVLVFDTLMGVVLSSVLERVGESGRVLAPFHKLALNENALTWFNCSESLRYRTLIRFPTSELSCIDQEDCSIDVTGSVLGVTGGRIDPDEVQTALETYRSQLIEKGEISSIIEDKCIQRKKRLERWQMKASIQQIRELLRDKVDSLIISTRCDPLSSLKVLLPILSPSCPFVVYCEFQKPMVECFEWAQGSDEIINVELYDTWYRGHQVLPGRTHPEMTMSSASGFCLTGIKVLPRNDPRANPPLLRNLRKRSKRTANEKVE